MPTQPNFQYSCTGGSGLDDGCLPYGAGSGYDAVINKGRRKMPLGSVKSEDWELRQLQRRQLATGVRDLNRNFAVAAWMIRRHLDYVSTFTFRPRTGNDELDQSLKEFMDWFSDPENCDPGARHSLADLARMWEMRATIDGDVLTNCLADGKVQTIEGDRVQTFGSIPYGDLGIDPNQVVNGVYVDQAYKAVSYMVFKRLPQWTGLMWDKAIPAKFAYLHGYFDRYDQVRGISPIASAVNSLRDVYENFDYALVKAKVAQLFAMAIYRKGSEALGGQGSYAPEAVAGTGETDAEFAERETRNQEFLKNLGRGPALFDMDDGDEIKVIESTQPSTEFQNFTQAMLMVAMKSLDLPYSFYDESHTNWIGQRQANIIYEKSAKIKQRRLARLLTKITQWRLGLAVMDGVLKLPKGMTVADIKFQWRPEGIPWVNPLQEVSADIASVTAGFDSQEGICILRGKDVYEIIDERAEVEAYARSKNVFLGTALPSSANDDPNKPSTVREDQDEETDEQDQKKKKPAKKKKSDSGDEEKLVQHRITEGPYTGLVVLRPAI